MEWNHRASTVTAAEMKKLLNRYRAKGTCEKT